MASTSKTKYLNRYPLPRVCLIEKVEESLLRTRELARVEVTERGQVETETHVKGSSSYKR